MEPFFEHLHHCLYNTSKMRLNHYFLRELFPMDKLVQSDFRSPYMLTESHHNRKALTQYHLLCN